MKCIIITRRHLRVALSAVLAVGLLFVGVFSFQAYAAGERKIPIYCVDKGEKKEIALSFDAAWGNEDTEELIEILAKHQVKATFFVVGAWVDKYPESVRQLAAAGHDIGNHSNAHPHMPQLSKEKMVTELQSCNEKVKAVTGNTPLLFRAPYGDYNNTMCDTVKECGMYTIQWDVDSKDWMEGHTAEKIVKDVCGKVKPGSIVLFHNAAVHTPQALPIILEKLISEGYSFTLIRDLIYKENYKIDHAGKQIALSSQN